MDVENPFILCSLLISAIRGTGQQATEILDRTYCTRTAYIMGLSMEGVNSSAILPSIPIAKGRNKNPKENIQNVREFFFVNK